MPADTSPCHNLNHDEYEKYCPTTTSWSALTECQKYDESYCSYIPINTDIGDYYCQQLNTGPCKNTAEPLTDCEVATAACTSGLINDQCRCITSEYGSSKLTQRFFSETLNCCGSNSTYKPMIPPTTDI